MPVQRFYQAGVAYSIRRLYVMRGQVPVIGKQLVGARHNSPWTFQIAINGAGMIEGTLTAQGAPARDRVVALSGRGLVPIASTYSDSATGKWRLYPLPKNSRYMVLGRDSRYRFNADVYDAVTPVDWEDEE